MRRAVFALYGTTCHLCGRPGATTVDHLEPISVRPDLQLEITNCRPAHRSCNLYRGDAPLATGYHARGW